MLLIKQTPIYTQVRFGSFPSMKFMEKIKGKKCDTEKTPEMDLGIFSACYVYIMLKHIFWIKF